MYFNDVTIGSVHQIQPCMFTRTNHVFRRWQRRPHGTFYYVTGPINTSITVDGPVDLYADWIDTTYKDPLVLDLDGKGILTTSLANGVIFDYVGNGQPVKTAWADPSSGFLVLDLNGDGQIVDGSQLLGNFTVLKNGDLAKHGFQVLAEIDLNGDGKVDRIEAEAAGLLIWRDVNVNGKSDPGELMTFEEAGVLYVETGYKVRSKIDENGNMLRWIGKFARSDGSIASAIDVIFLTEDIEKD